MAPPEFPRQTVLRLAIADDLDGLAGRAAVIDESTAGVVEHTPFGRQLVLHDPDGHTLVLLERGAFDAGQIGPRPSYS